MRERGASNEDISLVEQAKEEAIAAYDYVPTDLPNKPTLEKTGEEIRANLPQSSNVVNISQLFNVTEVEPLIDNLFIVRIGELPINQCSFVFNDIRRKTITIGTFESVGFSPEVYFTKNRKFKKIVLDYLSPHGDVIRTDEFTELKVKEINVGGLRYSSNGSPVSTNIVLKYKKHNVSTTSKEERNLSETKVEDGKEA
jgi:hypothetical protein